MKYCVFLFALVALVASNTTLADSHSWSFAAHPHPRKFEYSDLQNRLWQTALQGWGNDVEICDDVLQAEFEVYKLEYPIFVFSELALEPDMHRAWRDHLVKDRYHLPTQCMVSGAHARILELLQHVEWVTFRFCGNLASGAPRTFGEDYLAAGLEQMLDLAGLGAPEAMVNALYYAEIHPNLALNADVEYFLRMSLRRTYRFEQHWGVAGLREQFSNARLAFLDAAVKRRDLTAVRSASSPCAPPLERPFPASVIGTQ